MQEAEIKTREAGDPLGPDCQHAIGEDCYICQDCGKCDETLNDEDICETCANTVIIEIRGGVAELMRRPKQIAVIIRDYDVDLLLPKSEDEQLQEYVEQVYK